MKIIASLYTLSYSPAWSVRYSRTRSRHFDNSQDSYLCNSVGRSTDNRRYQLRHRMDTLNNFHSATAFNKSSRTSSFVLGKLTALKTC